MAGNRRNLAGMARRGVAGPGPEWQGMAGKARRVEAGRGGAWQARYFF